MTEWAEFYPLSRGAIFYTSRLRGSYGEARNRVPTGRFYHLPASPYSSYPLRDRRRVMAFYLNLVDIERNRG